jgi:alkanesulfonate monooxygenase SsuD/methylene tetrahydromethanopterin reductase-like flavin-dependent oxidoreductase (luciferase family)
MRIGTGLPNQIRDLRPDVLPAWAASAEQEGFELLTTVGRYAYPGVSDTVALAAAAAVTSRIELVSGVMLAPTWPGQLLAKELAGIDGISGGRLTAGIGVGVRPDDFVAEGFGSAGRGARLDRDLQTYREIWDGVAVGGGPNAAVPAGTRRVPLLFGGFAPAALDRMARWGEGYVGGSMPPAMVAPSLESAREAWRRNGREGSPRLVALMYYSLGDGEKGKANIWDYYSLSGKEFADIAAGAVCDTPQKVKDALAAYADLGVDDVVFNSGTDDIDDVRRLAEIVF